MSSLDELASIIDNAIDKKNNDELNIIIAIHTDYTETLLDSIEKAYCYYLLGNAWSGIRTAKHQENKSQAWSLEQEEVFKEIYYYRKAKLQNKFKDLSLELQVAINVNLANAFSHYGRTINAIRYFDKAIELKFFNKNITYHPNFILANLNKALAFEYYAKLEYDPNHAFIFSQFAYKILKETKEFLVICLQIYKDNPNYYMNIKNIVQEKIDYYKQYENIKNLEDLSLFKNYKTKYSTNEKKYRNWCLQNKLFLNPLNDLGNYQIASHDPLSLPNLTTSIDEGFPRFITYFNQIKQEYIANRHLLFEGLSKKTQKFYDKQTSITDDYDYNLYDINIEKIKLAFRGFYSIFDKIAFFMNEYFQTGLHETKVDFRKIWYDFDKQNKPKNIKLIFNQSENLALRGLYLISKDLFYSDKNSKDFLDSLEPEAEKLSDIRNHLEHKFINIKILNIVQYETVSDRKRNFYITEDDIKVKTLHLAQLAREAMIYLSFAVHIEESRKNNDGRYMSVELKTYKG
ncbi:MAG: LA2681 family HEPN domain-containing protein [Sulfurimonas sp.]|uniref:LA2681 family HEPN domain-containing protein n=1 Tax=Sulfurimonas sp. TaxID=2022749 RepID=UPI00263144F1|nr:LA2681 family HEPN domain-containing protein [Sulfurimonas sp.]MDD3476730.1 LA2681 family HEPN domain-containing protein [Sulfurimonas sp.]